MEDEKTSRASEGIRDGDPASRSENWARARWRAVTSRKILVRILLIILVVAITASVFVYRDQVTHLQSLGYLGAFLVALISSGTIFLPVPGIALIYALGQSLNPLLLGLVAGAGSALGEITGYMAGFSGQAVLESNRYYPRLERWMRRRGSIVIFVLSFVPNPFFDIAGAIAGALRFPLWKFLLVCFLGKTPRYMLIAFAGAYTMDSVVRFFEKYF
jgi:membrane protein YqaA with SNARE-associated domain